MPTTPINQHMSLRPFAGGVKLSPKNLLTPKWNISTLTDLPFNVYFLDQASNLLYLNNNTAQTCGFLSREDAVGISVRAVADKASADYLISNDTKTLRSEKILITEDDYEHKLDSANDHNAISVKIPLYSEKNKILGVFGCSVVLKHQSISEFLKSMNDYNFLAQPTKNKLSHAYELGISAREYEILAAYAKGCSAKQIAQQLSISHRTVETHISNIKQKLKLANKSELINFYSSM